MECVRCTNVGTHPKMLAYVSTNLKIVYHKYIEILDEDYPFSLSLEFPLDELS